MKGKYPLSVRPVSIKQDTTANGDIYGQGWLQYLGKFSSLAKVTLVMLYCNCRE